MSTITAFGPVEENALTQLTRCLSVAGEDAAGVLCADHHKGYSMPIGGVLASDKVVMPAGVGYDIACGNCAVRTNIRAADIDTAKVMDEVWRVISFGVGRKNNERIEDAPVFGHIANSPVAFQRTLLQSAQQQLGTVGSGNHYVDLFEDRADGQLWVGVHFGSRGFGHKTATHFLHLAGSTGDDMDAVPATIALGTALADDYLAAMEIAGEYAYAGRDWVVNRVLQILGAKVEAKWESEHFDPEFPGIPGTEMIHPGYIHNHHNYAWWETHGGKRTLVVRKGATPAFPGQLGFIGGSMGDDAVIVRGREAADSARALYSTVHGAGRVMGRREAAGKTKKVQTWRCKQCAWTAPKARDYAGCPGCGSPNLYVFRDTIVTPGKINWQGALHLLGMKGIELRGGGPDEAPGCYKRLPEVLGYHGDTIEVLHTLRPIGVAMAGADTYDPFKD